MDIWLPGTRLTPTNAFHADHQVTTNEQEPLFTAGLCHTEPGSAWLSQKAASLSFQTIQLHFPLPLFAGPSVNLSTLLDPRAYLGLFHSPSKPTYPCFSRQPCCALTRLLGHTLYSFKGQPSSCTTREAADQVLATIIY